MRAYSRYQRKTEGEGAYRVLEGLEEELVSQQIHCQLLVSEGVQACAAGAAGCPHLAPSPKFGTIVLLELRDLPRLLSPVAGHGVLLV